MLLLSAALGTIGTGTEDVAISFEHCTHRLVLDSSDYKKLQLVVDTGVTFCDTSLVGRMSLPTNGEDDAQDFRNQKPLEWWIH